MSQYGNPYEPPQEYTSDFHPQQRPNQTPTVLAVLSLCTGAFGMLSCLCCLLLPVPVISLGLGVAALLMEHDSTAKIMAILGVTLSCLTLLFWVLLTAYGVLDASLNNPQFRRNF